LIDTALRLYPLPAREIPSGAVYEDIELPPPRRRDASRPYVIINMVASVDGKIAIEGKSSRIGSETDRRAMRTLRSKADAVMIGASTLRAEKLSLGLDDPSFGPQPLAVIVTRAGDVPLESNLIVGGGQEVLMITPQHNTLEGLDKRHREGTRVLRVQATPSGGANLGEALKTLGTEHSVRVLIVEGGPNLSHALISDNLADELFITLAPKLLGGTREVALTILDGPALVGRDINLISAHLAGDELFLRYGLHPL
jgi:riboflavin-specific deaminase-like protein